MSNGMIKSAIPIDDPTNHPLAVYCGYNEQMAAFDLNVFVGNFKTREEASAAADEIAEFRRGAFNAEMLATQ